MVEDYNRIIDSLSIKFVRIAALEVTQPVSVSNLYDVQNTLILVLSGQLSLGMEGTEVKPGELLFLPAGKHSTVGFGSAADVKHVPNELFITARDRYFRVHNHTGVLNGLSPRTSFLSITFDAKAFDSVNFFTSLDLPAFVLEEDKDISPVLTKVFKEQISDTPGKIRMINLLTEELVVELFRFILYKKMFVEQLATNSNYFKDPRLIDIFNYIKENINGDLSNKMLAKVALVSEDYVGQYFKMLTGINPQDYIEYQRMEKAVDLLRTSRMSVREIGAEVGYKDTAYFCRRFKMMFGIPAGKMRKRESLVSN